MDNKKIDDGIRYLVKVTDVKSGKKVVVCPRTRFLLSLEAHIQFSVDAHNLGMIFSRIL